MMKALLSRFRAVISGNTRDFIYFRIAVFIEDKFEQKRVKKG